MIERIARAIACGVGSSTAIVLSLLLILAWAGSGPFFHYSNTWQLIINTSTTIITFVMVFFLQYTQRTNDLALHAKLDELIRAVQAADNSYRGLEDQPKEIIDQLKHG